MAKPPTVGTARPRRTSVGALMRWGITAAAVSVILVPVRFTAARSVVQPSSAPACAPVDDPTASAVLNCMTLVPVPELPMASAIIQLRPPATPFGVAVHPDGRPRYRLVATVSGLPSPAALGAFTSYVAWAYTLSLDSAIKLGSVRNGMVELGELSYPQFRILVSAEPSASVTTRGGRLVLRGTSPSARLMAHRDLVQPSAPGALRDPVVTPRGDMPAMHSAPNAVDGAWTMPPMPPSPTGGSMMRMAGLLPRVSPFRPGAGVDPASIPSSRPREIVRLTSGDTLRLESGLVRRTINGKALRDVRLQRSAPGPAHRRPAERDDHRPASRTGSIMPSAIHWHGVRLDNRFDGAPGVTQDAVAARRNVHVPRALPATRACTGITRTSARTSSRISGLYGNMLVRPPDGGVLRAGESRAGPDARRSAARRRGR